ncbi:MAG: DUF1572 family protein [Bacteroidota bacterium]
MSNNFLTAARKQFEYYKMLGDRTFQQISEEDFFWKYHEESNSIAMIIKHLWGNMRSRFTDFLTSDGEKEWRQRETEFADDIEDVKELLEKWEAGWKCVFDALDTINEENFDTPILIRNQAHTVLEAFNRQMAHYAYHVGQIVFVGKMLKGKDWQSLSIPKGKSAEYNAEKFSKPVSKTHFTEEFLDGTAYDNQGKK